MNTKNSKNSNTSNHNNTNPIIPDWRATKKSGGPFLASYNDKIRINRTISESSERERLCVLSRLLSTSLANELNGHSQSHSVTIRSVERAWGGELLHAVEEID